MPNTSLNFPGMQQPAPQASTGDQDNRLRRMMLVNMLQQPGNGPSNPDNPYGSFADSFNQQLMNNQMYGNQDQGQDNSQSGGQGAAQQAQSIMRNYNAPGGGSTAGYSLPSGARPSGMMGNVGRGVESGISSAGRGAAALGSGAMKALSVF